MREVYIEIALETGEYWAELRKTIQRSINVINNLISNISLHLSNDIICNEFSEKVIQSSNYLIINDYCYRIKNLCSELSELINRFYKSHLQNINNTVKWLNDEYASLNRLNSDKNETLSSNERVLSLYSSLKLCTSIETNCSLLLHTVHLIEKNIDYFVQHCLLNSPGNDSCDRCHNPNSPPQIKDISIFGKLANFVCYDNASEVKVIKSYLENA